jgi:glycosyltransferase involved in cell wall biosynthesis
VGRLALHQVTAGTAPYDAITHHVIEAQARYRAWGIESEIFAGAVHGRLKHVIRPVEELARSVPRSDPLLLHYSIDSPAVDAALAHTRRAAIYYHNVTPAHLLWRHAPGVAAECAAGWRRLPQLADRFTAAAAVSGFNADELRAVGYHDPVAIGILRPDLPLTRAAAPARDGGRPATALFVGRGIPNKAQHDLIRAIAALAETGRRMRLVLVGSWEMAPRYLQACWRLAADLGVGDLVEFTGPISEAALGAHYREADLFLCLSDHEGFCVPLLEAMQAELPVVAFAAGAVPETIGDAGLVLTDKSPGLVAEAIVEVLENAALRERLAAARPERLAHHGPEAVAERLRAFTERLL